MISWLAEAIGTARILRWLTTMDERLEQLMTQSDEVREIVTAMGGDVAKMRSDLAGVSGDVTSLKAQIDRLEAGQVLDEETLVQLRETAAGVAEVTDGLSSLNQATPDEQPTDPSFR